ncbi:MAG: SDR family NAD(P)-dependent oxidoreductase [Geminicoccaceae bacterium]
MADRVTWITGGTKGLGFALAKRLARRKHNVVVSARSIDDTDLDGLKGHALDITNHDQVGEVIDRIERNEGPIHQAVLNAGTHQPVDATEFTVEGLRKLVDINLFGTASCIEHLIPRMKARGRGRIAIVASVAGYIGLPTAAYYGTSKAALINLAETLRVELEAHKIVVQLGNPGVIKTPLTDKNDFAMPFLMPADKAAEAMAAGLDSDRFEITFPKVFTYQMKLLRLMPYFGSLFLTKRARRR